MSTVTPARSRAAARNSAPFSASRAALVADTAMASAPRLARLAGEVGQHLEGGVHPLGREAAALVHAAAQAGDFRALLHGLEAAIGKAVGDEQEDRVGPDVDGGVTRHPTEPTQRSSASKASASRWYSACEL